MKNVDCQDITPILFLFPLTDPYGYRIKHPSELGMPSHTWVSPISFQAMTTTVFCVGDPCCPAGWLLNGVNGSISCAGGMSCPYTQSECAMKFLATGGSCRYKRCNVLTIDKNYDKSQIREENIPNMTK